MNKPPSSNEYQAKIREAEKVVDWVAERLETVAAQAGRQMQKCAARLCEEAEDIWAEAQHLRNRNRDNS